MSTADAPARLTAELERAAVHELRGAWEDFNATHFRRSLRRPVLQLSDGVGRLGQWQRRTRTLEISRTLVLEHDWGVVLEVLKHEMAHQFVDESLGRVDEPSHGPAFRAVCADLGIDARAAGIPSATTAGAGSAAVLERISKLLALAQSPNLHEAQAAMSAAQRLMLKYNLESIGSGASSYSFRHLGVPTGRVDESQRMLAILLDEFFFVEPIWVSVWRPLEGKRGSVLEVCGTPENLALAEYVHGFLTTTAERLWKEHKKKQGIRRNRDRRSFVSGVMSGFRAKLTEERRSNEQAGLVWQGDAGLGVYHRRRHPHVRVRRHYAGPRDGAHAHGQAAGRSIVLHRGVTAGTSGGVKLLPGRS